MLWPPALNFFDRRIDLVREFEEEGDVRAVLATEDAVGVQFESSRQRIRLESDELVLQQPNPTAEFLTGKSAVERVLESMQPRSVARVLLGMSFVVGLESEFEDAIAASNNSVLSGFKGFENGSILDWSTLLDVRLESGAIVQLECGIVRPGEIPPRLSREVGQLGLADTYNEPIADSWDPSSFPPVSLFVGVTSNLSDLLGDPTEVQEDVDRVFESYSQVRSEVGRVVDRIYEEIVDSTAKGEK